VLTKAGILIKRKHLYQLAPRLPTPGTQEIDLEVCVIRLDRLERRIGFHSRPTHCQPLDHCTSEVLR
jgi:hypothetical protein